MASSLSLYAAHCVLTSCWQCLWLPLPISCWAARQRSSVTWKVSSKVVKWRSPNVDSPEWSPTAQLKPVTSSHNGTWQCIITCGSNQLSEHLTIKVQGNTQILEMKTPVFHCDQKKNKRVFSFPEPPPTTSTTTASLCSSKDSPKTTFAIVCSVLLSYFLLWLINNCFYVKLCSYVFIMNFLSLILRNYIKRGKIYSNLRAQPTF